MGMLGVAAGKGVLVTVVLSVLVEKGLAGLLRDNHLGQRESVKDGADGALVVEGDVVQHDTLTVAEANVELPILPLDLSAGELEGDALGVGDIDRFEVLAVSAAGLNGSRVVVDGGGLAERPPDLGNIDGNDLLLVGVEDGAEVERVLVLAVVELGAVVHEGLLEADAAAEALVISDGPGVAEHLVHVLLLDAANDALFDDLGVFAADVLDELELLHCDLRKELGYGIWRLVGWGHLQWAAGPRLLPIR